MQKGQYAGIIAIVLEYTSILLFTILTHAPLNIMYPISHYGTIDSTKYLFAATFSIAAVLFCWWGFWLAAEKKLNYYFKRVLVVALCAQILMSWFPETGQYNLIHSSTAIIVGFCMPALIYFFNRANTHKKTKLLLDLFIIAEVLMMFLYPLSVPLGLALITELIAGISFHLWVTLATFEKKLWKI